MNKAVWNKVFPHLIAIGIFLVISSIYLSPAFKGQMLNQSDVSGWKGSAQQSFEFKEKHGHYPYWTNSTFSGMPAYQIQFATPNKISIGYLHNYIFTLGLPAPVSYFFLACIMSYFLFMVLGIRTWVGVIGAIAYAYASYSAVIIATGHETKMICMAYAPAVLGGLLLLYQKKYLAGTILTTLFAAMIVWQNHAQVSYYTLIIALCLSVAFAIVYIRRKEVKHVLVAGLLAIVAGGMALAINTINIWPINELTKETMRGGRSELTAPDQKNKTEGGLDKDYAFRWSYGKMETFTLLVPGMYGGSNGGDEHKASNSKMVEKLEEIGFPEENAVAYVNQYSYWGDQSSTSGPVYMGAIICFLFIFALVYLKSWHKWWLLAATVIGILLAWGSNLPGLNYFLFDHLPYYKKFRAPSQALIIPQITLAILAALLINELVQDTLNREVAWKKFKVAGIITAALFAIVAYTYFNADFRSKNDELLKQNFTQGMMSQMAQGGQPTAEMQQQAETFGRDLVKALQNDRQHLFGADLLRSLLFVLLATALVGLYLRNKIKPNLLIAGLGILIAIDLFGVDTRYLGPSKFMDAANAENVFQPTPAVQQIQADPDKHFRVFDQASGDPFQSSVASYFFNSVGGYSPAKLALYQDIIEHQLANGNMQVFNMLNTRYFIVNNPATHQPVAQRNPDALGNAWFVKGIRIAKNADEEMQVLSSLNTRDSAVVDRRFEKAAGTAPVFDSTASIRLTNNLNDKITYTTKATSNQFAVFSEVYYPYGWDAYIDGKKAEYVRANYVLRGMVVPAGEHTIEFRFEPRSVIVGDKITMWSSLLFYLALIGWLVMEYLSYSKKTGNTTAVKQ
jgi:hypothetical protein